MRVLDEEEYSWFDPRDPNQYFIMHTTKAIRKGEEIFYRYGRRSNSYLISQYSFCLQDNKYDSVQFRLHLDKGINTAPQELLYLEYLSRKERKEIRRKGVPDVLKGVSGEYRVKRRMDERVMNALRSLHFKSKGQHLKVT